MNGRTDNSKSRVVATENMSEKRQDFPYSLFIFKEISFASKRAKVKIVDRSVGMKKANYGLMHLRKSKIVYPLKIG